MAATQNGPKRSWRFRWALVLLAVVVTGAVSLDPGFRLGCSFNQALAADASTGISKEEFERRVHDYLLAHPEIIGEAISRLEALQREQVAKQAQIALKSHAAQVFNDPNDPVGGNPKGDVTLVEFFDYNCPYCKSMVPIMTQAEAADPRLRIVYKEFPILGPDSLLAAKAALAASKQGKYVAFHRALYEVRGHVDENKVMDVARKVGLDLDRLKADMQAPEVGSHLEKTINLAQSLGITGTPGFAIGNHVFTGATDLQTLQATIAAARKSVSTSR